MLSIDEAIAHEREVAAIHRNNDKLNKTLGVISPYYKTDCIKCAEEHEQLAEWLEELKAIKSDGFTDNLLDMGFTKGYIKALEELKVIKEMDLSIPQHFTKEQSDWIKKYCINRNKEFYNKAIDDFANWLVEQGILGNRCIADGEITDYGKVYAKKYKEQLKEDKDD